MNYIILGFLPYFTLLVFVLGMGYRLYVWTKIPQPGAITLFPAPNRGPATFWSVIKESFLFPSLFKGDRMLWVFAWIFHITLAMIFVGHVRVFTDFPWLWAALGINADRMSAITGGAAGVIILVFGILLLARRMSMTRVKEVSNFSDFFALLVIIAILITGNMMRFGEHFDLATTRTYFSHLTTFSLSASSFPAGGMFMLHFLLAQILIMIMPFSKVLHFGGIFFTQTIIQRS